MIDRPGRDRLAELLRHLASGAITTDSYDEEALDISTRLHDGDPSLYAIYTASWFLYDDLKTYRLRGKHRLNDETRRLIARWILFLYSDHEYEWPVRSMISFRCCLLRILTLGFFELIFGPAIERRMRSMGSWDLWPFIREADFQQERAHPRLLVS